MPGLGSGFRSWVWDPALLVSQLLAMQGIFYASLTLIVVGLDALTATPRSLDQIFRYQSFFLRASGGSWVWAAYLANAGLLSLGLWVVVGRAKLCLDFAASAHVVHLLCSCAYNGAFPAFPSWWLLQVLCVAIATVGAEFLCMHSEMRSIPIGSFASARTDL